MSEPANEQLVNYLNILDYKGRQYTTQAENRWGGLIEPAPGENAAKTGKGLRVAFFGSWKFGYIVLETLKKYENQFPDRLNLVGLVTDNALNPDAKISKKKRIWNILDLPIQVIDETSMIESGLSHGIPVYTGEIKTSYFQLILEQWNPEVIVMCVFGQLLDNFIFNYPRYGAYNIHPSDLSRNFGAGPRPFDDLKERNAETTVITVHHVSADIDAGHIVGHSPAVGVQNTKGMVPENPLVVYDKMMEVFSPTTVCFTDQLWQHYQAGKTGLLDSINFENLVSEDIKTKLLRPICNEVADDMLPDPASDLFSSI
jgi:hypothetical protein